MKRCAKATINPPPLQTLFFYSLTFFDDIFFVFCFLVIVFTLIYKEPDRETMDLGFSRLDYETCFRNKEVTKQPSTALPAVSLALKNAKIVLEIISCVILPQLNFGNRHCTGISASERITSRGNSIHTFHFQSKS